MSGYIYMVQNIYNGMSLHYPVLVFLAEYRGLIWL